MSYKSLNVKLIAEFLYNIPYNNKIIIILFQINIINLYINPDIPRRL